MKAVIMAGGEGTRLRPILPGLPKPMALLAGKPVLERIICLLRHSGITDIQLTLRYMPEAIIDYFGDGEDFGVSIKYHTEEQPLGTAGGVRACFGEDIMRDILVISGDAACDFDLRELIGYHHRHRCAVTMALYPSGEPLQYGLVLTDREGVVKSFIEKPPWERVVTNLVNTGIYIISPRALRLIPENTKYDFAKDLFPPLMELGEEIRGFPMQGYWCDIGTPRAYYSCNLDAIDGRLRLYGDCATPGELLSGTRPPEQVETRVAVGSRRAAVSCNDRARLMRALSETLMEAGADFTDGLRLSTGGGEVCIKPAAGENAVLIESNQDRLCKEFSRLAEGLEAKI